MLICDFRGYEVPEMIKVRPVVVIRKHKTNSLLVTVVPLSTTAPDRILDHHLELQSHLQGASPVCWAKCDMVATVSLSRLDRIKVETDMESVFMLFHTLKQTSFTQSKSRYVVRLACDGIGSGAVRRMASRCP